MLDRPVKLTIGFRVGAAIGGIVFVGIYAIWIVTQGIAHGIVSGFLPSAIVAGFAFALASGAITGTADWAKDWFRIVRGAIQAWPVTLPILAIAAYLYWRYM